MLVSRGFNRAFAADYIPEEFDVVFPSKVFAASSGQTNPVECKVINYY